MQTKTKVIIVLIALAGAYGFGRWSAPEKIKTVEVIKEVEKKTEDTSKDVNKHKETHTVERPDGTKETTVTEDTSSKTDKHETDTSVKTDSKTVEETRASAKVTISALGAINVTSPAQGLIYGASVSKPILGPVAVGVFGLSNGIGGVSLGLTF